MAEKQQDDRRVSEERNRSDKPEADETPHPHPSAEEAKREAEAEDRFEATDN